MKSRKDLFNIVFLGAILLICCVSMRATGNYNVKQVPEYYIWGDINDDGRIDILDVVLVTSHYGTTGTPVSKASIEYDSGWVDITDKCGQYFNLTHNLNSTDIIVDIQGKTTQNGGIHQKHLGLTSCGSGWSKTYGGAEDEQLSCIVQTIDGGYALAGCTESFGAGEYDFWLVKTDSAGNMQWNQTYGGTNDDRSVSVVQTDDGGYALAGYTWSFGAGDIDWWLVKIDANGNMQWNRTYGGTGRDAACFVAQTDDGGYALAGYTHSYGAGGYDFWLVKINATGDMEWNETYGGSHDELAHSTVQTDDGGYALAGQKWIGGNWDFCLVKTDENGTMEWIKTYGGTSRDGGYSVSVVQTDDGGYALSGWTESFGAGGKDFCLVKTDENGTMEWIKTYGGTNDDLPYCIIQTNDGGYALSGWTESFGAGDGDGWLIKTDASGNMEWSKMYGGANYDALTNIIRAYDGGYLIVGSTSSYGVGGKDGWLVKTDVESGLAWTDSTVNTITLYRGTTDPYWNYVRVRIWKIKENP